MRSVGDRIHEFFDNERAPDLLAKYYAGSYTGALFDLPQLQSGDPDRFTAHSFAAVATLSVPLSGRAVMGLLAREAELSALLRALVDRDHGPFTEPLRNVLASDPSISERIDDVRAAAGPHP